MCAWTAELQGASLDDASSRSVPLIQALLADLVAVGMVGRMRVQ